MKNAGWLPAVAAWLVVVGGCSSGGDPLAPADDELAGRTYVMETVNGSTLPYQYPGTTHTTLWSRIVFDTRNATWVITSEHCEVLPCEGTNIKNQEVSGTYVRTGNVIAFQETRPGSLLFEGLIQDGGQRVRIDIMHPNLGESRRVYVDS